MRRPGRLEYSRDGHSAMAGAAGRFALGGLGVGHRDGGEVLGVDVPGHEDHRARDVLGRLLVGGEVLAMGCGVFGVAELTANAKLAVEAAHDANEFFGRDVLGEDLEVDGLGNGAVLPLGRRTSLLAQRRRRRFLRAGYERRRGEKGGERCNDQPCSLCQGFPHFWYGFWQALLHSCAEGGDEFRFACAVRLMAWVVIR